MTFDTDEIIFNSVHAVNTKIFKQNLASQLHDMAQAAYDSNFFLCF